MTGTTLPTYFISHGGGPWPWVPSMRKGHENLEASLKEMAASWSTPPKAILMVSGHWEGDTVEVMAASEPTMLYDYRNFPPHTYEVTYPAPGAPAFAARTVELLRDAGIEAALNPTRGYDHGTFVPMSVLSPDADIPLYQMSILRSYDPARHIEIGRALRPLRDEGVMIIGSGLSYHNLRALGSEARVPSAEFDAWLNETLALDPDTRLARLKDWDTAPSARVCHPEEDHLVPLFVAIGAAETEAATSVYHEATMMGSITASGFRFGAL